MGTAVCQDVACVYDFTWKASNNKNSITTITAHLPGPVQSTSDEQHSHRVSVECSHLKLQLCTDSWPCVPPSFHRDQVGFEDAGVEAAMHQAAHVAYT